MNAFLRYNDKYLSTEGLKLKDKAKMQLDYYKEMKTLQKLDINGWVKTTIDDEKDNNVVGCNSFLSQFVDIYQNNPEFRNNLMMEMVKALVTKIATNEKKFGMEKM